MSTPSNIITVSAEPTSVNSTPVNTTSDPLSSIMQLIDSRFSQMSNSITMLSQRIDSVSQAQVQRQTGERSASGSSFEGFPTEEVRLAPPQAGVRIASQADPISLNQICAYPATAIEPQDCRAETRRVSRR